MSTTRELPKLSTLLSRTTDAIAEETAAALESGVQRRALESVEAKRLQRDQRYASAVNIVTQARAHSGRDVMVTTPEDAGIINVIFSLLQKVAEQPVPEPDKIFSSISGLAIPSILEYIAATCASPPSARNDGAESRPLSEQSHSNENSGG